MNCFTILQFFFPKVLNSWLQLQIQGCQRWGWDDAVDAQILGEQHQHVAGGEAQLEAAAAEGQDKGEEEQQEKKVEECVKLKFVFTSFCFWTIFKTLSLVVC